MTEDVVKQDALATAIEYDFDKLLPGELESINRERGSAYIYVKLDDGTEEQFYVPEGIMRKANYYLNTPPGTKMKVKLGRHEKKNGAVCIASIERNPVIPPRLDARTLPWLKAKMVREPNPKNDFVFLQIMESSEFFNAPADSYTPLRLLRNSGYENGLALNQETSVRVICGERGLVTVAVRYPEGFAHPGRSLD